MLENAHIRLTPREQQVIDLMMEGKSFREIASDLKLTENTIKNFAHFLYVKVGVKGRIQLISYVLADREKRAELIIEQTIDGGAAATNFTEDQQAILHSVMEHFDEIYKLVGPTIKKAMSREKFRRKEKLNDSFSGSIGSGNGSGSHTSEWGEEGRA